MWGDISTSGRGEVSEKGCRRVNMVYCVPMYVNRKMILFETTPVMGREVDKVE
jgi:hypothetical protein